MSARIHRKGKERLEQRIREFETKGATKTAYRKPGSIKKSK